MTRFVVSLLAGVLVVAGGWLGWTRASQVDSVIAHPAEVLTDQPLGEGSGSEADPREPKEAEPAALPTKGTDPGRACVIPGPTNAAGMNRLFQQLSGEPTLMGADHGGSVELADGRRMFVFGDTIRDTSVVQPFMVRNSVLIANDGCTEAMPVADGGAAIPDDGEIGYWPMSLRATAVAGGTKVQVLTSKVKDLGGERFKTVGSALATFEVPTNRTPRLASVLPLGPTSNDPRVPTWGAAMWESDGRIHVFGTASNEAKTTPGWSLHVARATPADLADPDAWDYWDGSRWVTGQPSAALGTSAQIISSADLGVSHVVGVLTRGDSWYVVSKEGDYHGDTLAVWKAPSVTGPWTKHRGRSLANDSEIRRYMPLVHPDFPTADGRVLVSWSESPTTQGPYYSDPQLYRPHFAEIALP